MGPIRNEGSGGAEMRRRGGGSRLEQREGEAGGARGVKRNERATRRCHETATATVEQQPDEQRVQQPSSKRTKSLRFTDKTRTTASDDRITSSSSSSSSRQPCEAALDMSLSSSSTTGSSGSSQTTSSLLTTSGPTPPSICRARCSRCLSPPGSIASFLSPQLRPSSPSSRPSFISVETTRSTPDVDREVFYDVDEEVEGQLIGRGGSSTAPPSSTAHPSSTAPPSSNLLARLSLRTTSTNRGLAGSPAIIPHPQRNATHLVYDLDDDEEIVVGPPAFPELDLTVPSLGGASSSSRRVMPPRRRASHSALHQLMEEAASREPPPPAARTRRTAQSRPASAEARRRGRSTSSSGLLANSSNVDFVNDSPALWMFPPFYHNNSRVEAPEPRHSFVFGWTAAAGRPTSSSSGGEQHVAEQLSAALRHRGGALWRHILAPEALRRWGLEEVTEGMSVEEINRLPSCVVRARRSTTTTTTCSETGKQQQQQQVQGFGKDGATSTTTVACGICMDTYNIGDRQRRLECLHVFHSECVDKWLKLKGRCPVCKFDCKQGSLLQPQQSRAPTAAEVAAAPTAAQVVAAATAAEVATATEGRSRASSSAVRMEQRSLQRGRRTGGETVGNDVTTSSVIAASPLLSEDEGVEFLGARPPGVTVSPPPTQVVDIDDDVIVDREEIVLTDDWSVHVQWL
eukprot:GHVS01009993.1.p1 GENE.GHVS01009993.1~~GHVS01009993.1.p1  ORF type:complete len:686 (+),score=182.42 GHVS01009993.1:294-2351(+)